ncbi:MAG: PulJ/GspJ family protein [Chthoniobacterales bacterium]
MKSGVISRRHGATLLELSIAMGLIGVVGLAIFSMLNIGMVLGAKNAAVNMAHQQARIAMLQLVQDLHSAVSLPALTDKNSIPLSNPAPGVSAAGISFQLWAGGPFQVCADATADSNVVQIQISAGDPVPKKNERLIIQSHQIEMDITAVTNLGGRKYNLTLAAPIGVAIQGTQSPTYYNIPCFIADRCSYVVNNGALEWHGPTNKKAFAILGNDIISETPFSIPSTPAGALYYRFVAAIDLSTTDSKSSNRGFKSANILLNGQVPMRARLTTYQ